MAAENPMFIPCWLMNGVTDVVMEKDVMLNFPYHSFNSVIDLLREAAVDPYGHKYKDHRAIAWPPSQRSFKRLINAARNGKHVTVMLELRARFDERSKSRMEGSLEEEGARVLTGFTNLKIHAKLCVIKKRISDRNTYYGFVSTGNLNEKTAMVYADHCLLTSNQKIMADANRIFSYLEQPKGGEHFLKACKMIIQAPSCSESNYINTSMLK
jgi:polyphosphate kinase